MEMKARITDHEIDPIYTQRWSPRAFSNKEVEDIKLNRIFEAARWAPSASNLQPWHFIVAKNKDDREKFLTFINEVNVEWCKNAPVLVVVTSKTTRNEKGAHNNTHAFDVGTAWGYLSLEAVRQGLITHGMGGFDREKAKEVLHIPDEYSVQAVIAVGYHDPSTPLPDRFKQGEFPSNRKAITQFVSEGSF